MLILLVLALSSPLFAEGLPLFLVPNQGQFAQQVRFAAETPDVRAAFLEQGAVFQSEGQAIRVEFVGARPQVLIEGLDALAGHANYFVGRDPQTWHSAIPVYARVIYRGIYPSIDAVYSADTDHKLKSEFRVAPGADPTQIRLAYPGADSVSVETGALRVRIGRLEFRESAPEVYQDTEDGVRQTVPASWQVHGDGTASFSLGHYDASRTLVIDPVITYSTYLGGSGAGAVSGIARDGLGNLYATGWTEAINFPIAGALQASNRGGVDAFVIKMNAAGTALLFATYIGGSGEDRGAAIAVDALGQAHITGVTGSSNFPLASPARGSFVGGKEAFALKLNAQGSALTYSTYLGGSNAEWGTALAVDSGGNAYIGGDTLSADFGMQSPVQAVLGGRADAFLVKLNAAGVRMFSTFLGGAQDEHVGGIALEPQGEAGGGVYVVGGTVSTNFPVSGATQPTNAGGQDAFVTKLRTDQPFQILYSTYLGGTLGSAAAPEQANAVVVDASGNLLVAGVASSADFPVTSSSFQTSHGGSRDAFVTKFNSSGSARIFSTYLGWTGFDWASAIATDAAGSAYVAGYTSSVGFANIGGVQPGFRGLYDGFIAKLSATGTTLNFSTLYGGTGSDQVNTIAVDSAGNMFAGGQTSSLDFPTASAYQNTNTSGNSAWVARIGVTAPPSQVPSADSANLTYTSASAVTVTMAFSHPAGATSLTSVAMLLSRTSSADFACLVTFNRATNALTLANNLSVSGGTAIMPGSGTAQNTQCQLNGAGSGAVLAGNTLTLTLSLILDTGFPGNNTVYLYAADANVNTGWVARPGVSVVSADSVSPGSGSGAFQTFSFVFSDTKSPTNVLTTAMLIGSSLTGTGACWLVYDRGAGTVALLWDSATGSHAKPLGSSATIQNSQCALGVPSLTTAGNSIILSVPLAFTGPFTGPKNIYMYAVGPNGATGWVQRGTYTVIAGGVPVANGVSPATGTGAARAFTFTVSDQAGSNFLAAAAMLFTSTPGFNLTNACYVVYDKTTNRFSLLADALNGSTSFAIGAGSSISNGQCTLYGSGSSVVVGATSIIITLNLAFNPSFAGAKNSYLFASENGFNTGWVQVGTWSVPGVAPTAVTLSPASGSGLNQMFTLTATTAKSPSDVTTAGIIFGAGTVSNACWATYSRSAGTVGLYNDAGTAVTTKPLGSAATLQNNQCAIGYSVVNITGNSLALTIQVVFKSPAFAGTRTTLISAANAWGNTPYSFAGSWTVP